MEAQPKLPDCSRTRRTRFVCISDTHNASPNDGAFKLPPGDVLIHAGDLTNQGTFKEIQKTVDWIAESDYEAKIVVAGNHDITLDNEYYAENWTNLHERYPQDSQACIKCISTRLGVTYLNHESKVFKLSKPGGPKTTFKVFGSPYSPRAGDWGFGYDQDTNFGSEHPWAAIPQDTNIIVTHTPPRGHCDDGQKRSCEALARIMARKRPQLVVCGHIHEGWGAERIAWKPGEHQVNDKAEACPIELDKLSKKLAKIDLTEKAKWRESAAGDKSTKERLQYGPKSSVSSARTNMVEDATAISFTERGNCEHVTAGSEVGLPLDPGRDGGQIALGDRLARAETLIVNAAIMARSRHGGRSAGRQFNKPIIVDIDLPIWDENDKTGAEVES